MMARVAIKLCHTYDLDRLEEVLAESLELIGGSSSFFKSGESALVKPNLLTDAKPEDGITTHPNFVQAVVRTLKKAGLRVAIADIPGEHRLESNLEKVYIATGMRDVSEKENVKLLTETKFIEEDGVIFSSWVREFDYLISVPKLKTHVLMTLTGAVKNIFGLTPRLYRINLHRSFIRPDDFAKMLLNVYRKCKPTLSFVDGILAMEGNGPAHSGTLRDLGLVAASSDAFALDSVLAYIMGLKPEDIPTNRQGSFESLGVTDLEDIEVLGDGLENFRRSDFELPPTYLVTRLPEAVLKFLTRLAQFRPRVDRAICNGCRVCIENCPLSAIELKDRKAKIDYQRCVDCFCCLETCPIGAMKTKSGPLIYALELRNRLKERLANALK